MKQKIPEKLEFFSEGARNFGGYFLNEIFRSFGSLRKIYSRNKLKAILVSIVSFLLLLIAFLLVVSAFYPTEPTASQTEVQKIQEAEYVIPRGDENNIAVDFLNAFEDTVKLLKPVLDGFVGSTADVTGISNSDAEGNIVFYSGGKVKSSKTFYDKVYYVAFLIAILLFVANGINLIASTEANVSGIDVVKTLLGKFLLFAFLLIAGRYLMSWSIQFTNEINNYFRGGKSLTEFLMELTGSIRSNLDKPENGFVQGVKNVLSLGTYSVVNIIKALPILLPLILILLFLLFISFQFIIRWISLYFLSAIQPLASVFVLFNKTKVINENFWKTWFTLLIHQPFFVLGYSILQNLLLDNLKSGPSFESIIIFLGTLIFLSSVNVLVGKIFGDAWTAISANIQSGLATGMAMGAAGRTAQFAKNAGKSAMKLSSNSNYTDSSRSFGKNLITSNSTNIDKPTLAAGKKGLDFSHKELHDPMQSKHAKNLVNEGYSVNPTDSKGVLSVGGDFFAKSNGNGTSTLYTSRQEGINDGVNTSDLKQVSLNGVNVLDSSNYQAKQSYNSTVSKLAKAEGIQSSDVHIKQSSSRNRVQKSLQVAKETNAQKGIQGISIERIGSKVPKTGDQSQAQRQMQIHVYDDILNP